MNDQELIELAYEGSPAYWRSLASAIRVRDGGLARRALLKLADAQERARVRLEGLLDDNDAQAGRLANAFSEVMAFMKPDIPKGDEAKWEAAITRLATSLDAVRSRDA